MMHFPFAYVGPGAGFAFLGSFLTLLLSLLASLASLLLWPFRMLLRLLRRGRSTRTAHVKKAIFLGLDGLDPELTEKLMVEGKLPHLTRLKEQGSYRRLRTTLPALSPVAWSTFATGVNPAKHKGEPFWNILGRHGVESTILRLPVTFPPDGFNGRLLSGTAPQGGFSCFTRRPGRTFFEGGNRYPLIEADGALAGVLAGPGDSILFRIHDAEGDPVLDIQDGAYPLRPHEYTPWIRLKFGRAHGIVRLLLIQTGDDFLLYATAVQIDPENPSIPISHPPYYAPYLAKLLGPFSTLAMAEDTSALNEGVIDEDDFLTQAKSIQSEREAMFFSALDHQESGVVACVFDTSDRIQHMFYRYLDPARASGRHSCAIERMYCDMDRLVGRTLEHADTDTAVFVLSGHGFCSFRRGVNLNAWLHRSGYLALDGDEIDWPRTRVYTSGLGGLNLNLRGREAEGTVDPKDAPPLSAELISRLAGLRDEDSGEIAIRDVYASPDAAPDLIVGYERGYRASWDAARGMFSPCVFEDNVKAWSGDHCVDPSLVPGVLFSNRKLNTEDPGIEDMAPTALRLFGIEPPEWMEGKSLCGADCQSAADC
jgi:predicted AlkP superfamily phosphohydrolase/phosphomutase